MEKLLLLLRNLPDEKRVEMQEKLRRIGTITSGVAALRTPMVHFMDRATAQEYLREFMDLLDKEVQQDTKDLKCSEIARHLISVTHNLSFQLWSRLPREVEREFVTGSPKEVPPGSQESFDGIESSLKQAKEILAALMKDLESEEIPVMIETIGKYGIRLEDAGQIGNWESDYKRLILLVVDDIKVRIYHETA